MSTSLPHADRIDAVLKLWFGDEPVPSQATKMRWFQRSDDFDALLRRELGADHRRAIAGELAAWEADPRGVIALIILVDQLSRNLNRESPGAWANDPQALGITRRAMEAGLDLQVPTHHCTFLYMPLMHAESAGAQRDCVAAFEALAGRSDPELRGALAQNIDYARQHQAIVDRFGRFPHRNAILGRVSTEEELAFLQEPGSSF